MDFRLVPTRKKHVTGTRLRFASCIRFFPSRLVHFTLPLPRLSSHPPASSRFSSIFSAKSLEASQRGRERRLVTFSSRPLFPILLPFGPFAAPFLALLAQHLRTRTHARTFMCFFFTLSSLRNAFSVRLFRWRSKSRQNAAREIPPLCERDAD